ncbi:hypothetical protein JCM10213_007754 [Rhodosporidiobolus nylandii]
MVTRRSHAVHTSSRPLKYTISEPLELAAASRALPKPSSAFLNPRPAPSIPVSTTPSSPLVEDLMTFYALEHVGRFDGLAAWDMDEEGERELRFSEQRTVKAKKLRKRRSAPSTRRRASTTTPAALYRPFYRPELDSTPPPPPPTIPSEIYRNGLPFTVETLLAEQQLAEEPPRAISPSTWLASSLRPRPAPLDLSGATALGTTMLLLGEDDSIAPVDKSPASSHLSFFSTTTSSTARTSLPPTPPLPQGSFLTVC